MRLERGGHLALRDVFLRQNHEELGVLVLESMALVDNDVRPLGFRVQGLGFRV